MNRLIVCNIMSLDGFYASSEGNPLVLPMDPAFDSYNLSLLRTADALLLGGNSYRMMMPFWPAQATNPDAGAVHKEFGSIYSRIPVHVVSDSLTAADVAPWAERTTVVRRDEAVARMKDLKATGTVVSFASRITWNALLAAGVVDELHLIIGATALGAGTPAFAAPAGGLTCTGVEQLAGSDNFVVRYALGG
ncbi:dihydrofolate reductase family protein [Pseudonocardia sp. TRM90224]|uniref:dihydrofolate reductase family protein n=1 Tax=Pseudonocardia sp. TRM90224 TaxID=2812678 RepID=UPI001E5D4E40|nr:dihydrofolate reductase family protein [Pseudonocardia sp. TRM90224]